MSPSIHLQKKYPKALAVAGSDSGGGAGIQADLKTFAALKCYGTSVITTLTAQNTLGVLELFAPPPRFVKAQLDAVLSDIGCDAVKIGMLYTPEIVMEVARAMEKWACKNIVLDPVMVSSSGKRLLKEEGQRLLEEELMPKAALITPNLDEASVLLGRDVAEKKEMERAARDLGRKGAQAVLLKGGHLNEKESADLLYIRKKDALFWFSQARVPTKNNHGTGCTLSSAICAGLAKGLSIFHAVREAKDFTTQALRAGAPYQTGQGHGPMHHLHPFWD